MKRLIYKLKKQGKALLCALIAAAMVVSPWGADTLAVHAGATERTFDIGVNSDNIIATLDSKGVLTVSGAGEIRDYTAETAPFQDCGITSVKLGNGITSIGDYLFYNCGKLTGTVTLPKNVVRIGDRAFSGKTAAQAPKPSFVDNLFTEALLTGKAEQKEETPSSDVSKGEDDPESAVSSQLDPVSSAEPVSSAAPTSTPEPSEDPVSSAVSSEGEPVSEPQPQETEDTVESAPAETEGAAAAQVAPADEKAASAPEESSSAVSAPEEETASLAEETPSEPESKAEAVSSSQEKSEVSSQPAGEEKKKYTVEKIVEQEIGEEIFYAGKTAGAFYCSEKNESFRAAMKQAGFKEADSIVSAVFDCGEEASGGTVSLRLPVTGGKTVLPEMPEEFASPEGGDLYAYTFGGWTESKDKANTVRAPGSTFQAGDRKDLYFIANWVRRASVKINVKRSGKTTVFSVPEVKGYTVTSFQWQVCDYSGASEPPADQETLAWKDISGAVKQTYSRTLAAGDSGRLFRCLVTVKKENTSLITLFSANQDEELSLPAVRSGITEVKRTLAVSKGTGQAAAVQTVSLPVTALDAGSTVYKITSVALTGDFFLVKPSESGTAMTLPAFGTGQNAGNTYALRAMPTGSGWTDASAEGLGAYVLTQAPSGETWNSSVNHVWKRGDGYPIANNTASEAEVTFTLAYRSDYEDFVGGQAVVTLEEFQGTEVKNTVVVTLFLEDISKYAQTAAVTAGRSFAPPTGENAVIVPKGAVTAGFTTEYYPVSVPAGEVSLRLYRDGDSPALVPFPTGTKIVLGDLTGSGAYSYGLRKTEEGESSLALSGFSGHAVSQLEEKVTEQMLFAVDFSGTAGLEQGSYFLVLAHGADRPLSEMGKAAFTVDPPAGEEGKDPYTLSMTGDVVSGAVWTLSFTASTPAWDTRYLGGQCVKLALKDGENKAVPLPEKTHASGTVENIFWSKDGTVSFTLPESGSGTVSLDLSGASELAAGSYQIQAELRPKPGLQADSDAGSADASAGPLAVILSGQIQAASSRSLSIALGEGAQRLIDVPAETEEPAALQLSISYAGAQTGDKVEMSVLKKTGKTPDAASYTAVDGCTVSPGETELSGESGVVEAAVSIPPGQAAGTYRVLARLVSASGAVEAEEPYNFILR